MEYKSLAILITFILFSIACSSSGGGGIPGEEIGKTTECVLDKCTTTSINVAGNFDLGEKKSADTKELVSMSLSADGDALDLSCNEDQTTENGASIFSCNLDDYYLVGAMCIHGIVYISSESDDFKTWDSTGCQALSFYCDNLGFAIEETCNGSNLVKAVSSDSDFQELSLETPVSEEAWVSFETNKYK